MAYKGRNVVYGFLVWLIPFAVSFMAFPLLAVDYSFPFNTLMIVVGGITGVALLVKYFRRVTQYHLSEGIAVGVTWFVINVALDLVVLIPATTALNQGQTLEPWQVLTYANYFPRIGLRYLLIPITAIGFGFALRKQQA